MLRLPAKIAHMFPINSGTLTMLVPIAIALLAGLALQLGWRRRLALLLIPATLPTLYYWSTEPIGKFVDLVYMIIAGVSFLALVTGFGLGWLLRSSPLNARQSMAALVGIAAIPSTYFLLEQYVPASCLNQPLQVSIAGEVLHIPHEIQAGLGGSDVTTNTAQISFGRRQQKRSFARICRLSGNGSRTIEVDVVRLSPVTSHLGMASVCDGPEPPNWCSGYSPEPYRYIGQIAIAPESEPFGGLYLWENGRPDRVARSGNLTIGSVCQLPIEGSRTQCFSWQPFGNGSRLTVSTNNLDPTFDGMAAQDALEMTEQTRDTILSIVGQ
jgi:hypothetical protein